MDKLKLFFKGLIIGCASILPGVSGGTMALSLGIYERLIKIASNIFKDFKDNVKFLVPMFLGAGIGVILLSNIISVTLDKYEEATILLFVGLMIGGIPSLLSKVKKKTLNYKNVSIAVISFLIVIIFVFMNDTGNQVLFINMNVSDYLLLFLVGIIAAATLVIPGISGSLILMIMGYYRPIIDTISSLFHFEYIVDNLLILVPFGLGVIVGIIVVSKIIKYLLNKYHTQTYYSIYGIIFASIIGILYPLNIGLAIIVMFIGIFIAYRMGE